MAIPSNFPILFIFVKISAVSLTPLSAAYSSGRLNKINLNVIMLENNNGVHYERY